MNTTGPFEVHKIARMLYKAGLGAIALERGRNMALDHKFDAIRNYIINGGTFPNKLMLFKEGLPSFDTEVEWYEVEGIPIMKFIVLGFSFSVILGETPKFNPVDELKPHIVMYDLALEKPEVTAEQMNVKPKESKT